LVISSWSETSSIASPANAVPPPVRMPGTSGSGRVPSESSAALLPNRAVAQCPPIWRSPSVRIQGDRPERVLVAAHRAGRVDDQPDVRLLDRCRHLSGDAPRMRRDRPPGGLLRAAARVGAAVEAPARGALVDLTRSPRDRLAQAVGVAAGERHLVGERGPVDPPVGQPPGG